jgi:hypothetical protein
MKHTPEEIAELLKERPHQPHYIAALVRRAVKAEREECAKVCEGGVSSHYGLEWREATGTECAAAIRARGEKVPR